MRAAAARSLSHVALSVSRRNPARKTPATPHARDARPRALNERTNGPRALAAQALPATEQARSLYGPLRAVRTSAVLRSGLRLQAPPASLCQRRGGGGAAADVGPSAGSALWSASSRGICSSSSTSISSRGSSSRAMRGGARAAVGGGEREVLVQHILIPEGTGQEELAQQLLLRLQQDPDSFDELAEEHSKCPSREQGGVLGWISKGRTLPDFEAAAFAAGVGEVVQARTRHGLHLLRVMEQRSAAVVVQISVAEFEAVRQQAAESKLAAVDPTEGVQLVDVREPQELDMASIPGFASFPLSQFSSWGPEVQSQLSPDMPTYVLCHHGVRSQQMAQFLVSQGFQEVFNISGGIDAYSLLVDRRIPRY